MKSEQSSQEQPNPLRCVIYTRSAAMTQVASSSSSDSLARQQEVCRKVAEDHHWQVDDLIFSAHGSSGLTWNNRPALSSLLRRAEEQPRPFDYVLVESGDRLSRDMVAVIRLVNTLASHGVGVYFVSERLDSRDSNLHPLIVTTPRRRKTV